MKPTQLYRINAKFAARENLPIYFVARELIETQKAVYLWGHGTLETVNKGVCCQCGRKLTHPVSVALGIGPHCGAHWWDWSLVGGFSVENIERLKREIGTRIKELRVDGWVPKGVIKSIEETTTVIDPPVDHPILKRREDRPTQRALGMLYKGTEPVLKIMFPFDRELLTKVKELLGRRFVDNGKEKFWTAPCTVENVEKLQDWGFTLEDPVTEWYEQASRRFDINSMDTTEVPGLRGTLYPFQQRGVAFIEARQGRALIGDEMGLGKTIQALAWLQLHPELRPAVIVTPASLKINWEREIMRWITDWGRIEILEGTNPKTGFMSHERLTRANLLIINYDILPHWVDTLRKLNPQVLITDECHYYKNNSAKRTKAVKRLAKRVPHFIALSGTPIVNRPVEAYNALNIIDPTVVPSFWDYAQRYCGAKHNGYGWDFSGATNTQELHRKLVSTVMIRRLKQDVLTELPDKTRAFVPMELDNRSDYNMAELDFIDFVQKTKGAEASRRAESAQALAEIEGLKQLSVRGKLRSAISWIRNFLDVDGKLVVFATHRFVIDTLMEEFKDVAVKVDGSVSGTHRQDAVDRFQTDDGVRLFVGNIRAAGVGITLTASSNVAFVELPWTPGELTQAEDRCHRIGQRAAVNIHYLLATNTIEEHIAGLLDRKRKVLDAVLDGQQTEEESLLSELIKQYE